MELMLRSRGEKWGGGLERDDLVINSELEGFP